MDLALVDAAFVDAEASRQQERVMVETGFAGTDDVAPTVRTARAEDVQLKCKMVEKELGLLKFVLAACVILVLAVLFRKYMFVAFLVVNGSSWMLVSLWCRSMEDVLN